MGRQCKLLLCRNAAKYCKSAYHVEDVEKFEDKVWLFAVLDQIQQRDCSMVSHHRSSRIRVLGQQDHLSREKGSYISMHIQIEKLYCGSNS